MKSARILVLAALVLIPARAAHALLLPCFNADECTSNATDVVVASATKKLDSFVVLETWRGGLKPGELVNFPELASFAGEKEREIHERHRPWATIGWRGPDVCASTEAKPS